MVEIENTFCEAFDGIYSRVIITADDIETLKRAAYDATSTPGTVIGRVEGGIERWLNTNETPDGREGAVLQFWYGKENIEKFNVELSYRIRQDILVKPFTAVFDASINPSGKMDMIRNVGHCGDGHEWKENKYGREMIIIPIAIPDFEIESTLGYMKGIMGANFWYMCAKKSSVMNGGKKALEAIAEVEGAIAPFDICSAASKPETNYPWIGPTTNHPYCPSLKKTLNNESRVPENVKYIPEIVINGIDLDTVKKAMKAGIEALMDVEGVINVSAGNYGGQLGDHKIYLIEL
ncbi:MAG: formylmethanofuran--tetrahydromethanopterin N-formyltransferase [Methanobacterium sp.]|nr:formylmethanofuran--tetrahydromethanopterin N-formyltransferase [Methanobacterium sp.]